MDSARAGRVRFLTHSVLLLAVWLIWSSPGWGGSVTYEVDPVTGRVTKATFADLSYMTYSYDANGNRIGAVLTLSQDSTPPTDPSALTASAASESQINLNWTASTDNRGVSGYRLERCQGAGCNTFAEIAQPAGNSYSDAGVLVATTYRYRVRAIDAANNLSDYSSIASATTPDTTAPSAPGSPTFSGISGTEATVSYTAATDNIGVTSYEYSLNGGGSWTSVGSVVTFSLSGLSSYVTYTVRVRGRDAAGNSGSFSSASFATLDTVPPTAPTNLNASPFSQSQIDLTWTASTDNRGVAGYRIERCQGAGCSNFGEVAQPAATSYSDAGLEAGTSYSYRVRAVDQTTLYSTYSNISTANTGDTSVPTAPGTPSFSAITETSASASWTAATDNVGVTSYEYSLNGGTWTPASSPQSLTGLASATTYTFEVRARDAANNAGPASSNSFTTSDATAPSVPGIPSISSITETTATASWTAATDNVGVTGYQYSLNGGTWTSTTSPKNLTGLTAGTNYTFQVRAGDAAGNWGSASSASFKTADTTDPSAPGTPTFGSITETSATASWTAASDNVGVTGYQYSLNGGAWTSAAPPKSLTGLSAGTNYTFQVRARDAVGNWGPASSGSFQTADLTPPTAPGTLTFSSITGSSATANWGAASDNVGVTGYRYRLNGSAWVTIGASPASLTGLSQATSYTFEVSARDSIPNWGPVKSANFTTRDVTAPSAPGTPSISGVTHNSATASWSAATDNVGVTSYQFRLNGGSWISNGWSTSVNLSDLSPGASYTLEARAGDAAHNFGSASSVAFVTKSQITISNRSVSTSVSGSGAAIYMLYHTGDLWTSGATSTGPFDSGTDWIVPKTGMGNYQVRATPGTGSCSGAMNTWLTLGSGDITWNVGVGGPYPMTASCSFTLQIRESANPSVILGAATITLTAHKP